MSTSKSHYLTDYQRIENALSALKLESTLSALKRAVDEEAGALRGKGQRRDARLEDARSFYAGDIIDAFYDERPLTPEQILSHRRRPTAWAIARILKKEGKDKGVTI